jgi:hypothetical protein
MGIPKLYSKHVFIAVGGREFQQNGGSVATLLLLELLLESLIPGVPQMR